MPFLSFLLSFIILSITGYKLGVYVTVRWFIDRYKLEGMELGLDAFSIGLFGLMGGVVGLLIGQSMTLIILHRLSKRLFPGVAFWRTTLLALLTTFLFLFLWLLFWPK